MTGLQFDLSCQFCGYECELVNSGRVILGRETTAVVRCVGCGNEFSVHVDMRATKNSPAFMALHVEQRASNERRVQVAV